MIEIALKEWIKRFKAENQEKISNLKIFASGQIIKLEITGDTSQMKVGDTVVKDQLLISGTTGDVTGGMRVIRSFGKVIVETEKSLVAEIPMKQTVQRPTDKQIVHRSVRIFGLELPLSLAGHPRGEYQEGSQRVTLKDKTNDLPISLYTETRLEQTNRETILTEAQVGEQARTKIEELKQQEWKGVRISSSNLSGKIEGDVYRIALYCRYEENIAPESEILSKP